MATRHGAAAGVVTLAPVTTAVWQVLDGDWGTAANWSIAAVPGIADPVVISDGGSASNPWTVTETNEFAASLQLDMNLGTLEAAGGLTVAGPLTQTAGTPLGEPGH